ncbi:MAG: toxin-antitoxin system YwqK family antitoxin [Flavobacteriales bacterium]|nr:toxin-antitoxin system YwqK family antitoxin [Flavobacteriales bacterium]
MRSIWTAFLFLILTGTLSAQVPEDTVQFSDLRPVDGVFTLDDEPYTGEAYFIKKDGTPMAMRSYVNGVKQGLWRTWHPNGNMFKEGTVIDEKEHGEYKEYYENGILRYQYHYDMGKKTGRWLGWYEDGTIYTERNFKDDQLHGRLVHYDENGEPRMTEEYRDGKVIASDRFKTKSGDVKIERK